MLIVNFAQVQSCLEDLAFNISLNNSKSIYNYQRTKKKYNTPRVLFRVTAMVNTVHTFIYLWFGVVLEYVRQHVQYTSTPQTEACCRFPMLSIICYCAAIAKLNSAWDLLNPRFTKL